MNLCFYVLILLLLTHANNSERGTRQFKNLSEAKTKGHSYSSSSQSFGHQRMAIKNRSNTSSRTFNYEISNFILEARDMKMKFYNPAIIYVKNRLLLCSRFLAQPYDYDYTKDTMGCSWFPSSPTKSLDFYMLRRPYSDEYIYGEDPRVIVV